jgi:hypothetical protein
MTKLTKTITLTLPQIARLQALVHEDQVKREAAEDLSTTSLSIQKTNCEIEALLNVARKEIMKELNL